MWSTPSAMAGMGLLDDKVHGISPSILPGALISILPLCVAGATEFKLCKCSCGAPTWSHEPSCALRLFLARTVQKPTSSAETSPRTVQKPAETSPTPRRQVPMFPAPCPFQKWSAKAALCHVRHEYPYKSPEPLRSRKRYVEGGSCRFKGPTREVT